MVVFAGTDHYEVPVTGQKMLSFGIGSNMLAKKWAEENFFELGQELIEKLDVFPLIIGGTDEQEAGERLIQK